MIDLSNPVDIALLNDVQPDLWDSVDNYPTMCVVCLWYGHPAKHIKNTFIYPNVDKHSLAYQRVSWKETTMITRIGRHLGWVIKTKIQQVENTTWFPPATHYTRFEMRFWTGK